ncbi:hypothetical protein PAMP_002463 [Pampus punctatissimus]
MTPIIRPLTRGSLTSKDPELVHFEVLVQNDHRGSKVVSYTKLVVIKVFSLNIVISKTHKGLIMALKSSLGALMMPQESGLPYKVTLAYSHAGHGPPQPRHT